MLAFKDVTSRCAPNPVFLGSKRGSPEGVTPGCAPKSGIFNVFPRFFGLRYWFFCPNQKALPCGHAQETVAFLFLGHLEIPS